MQTNGCIDPRQQGAAPLLLTHQLLLFAEGTIGHADPIDLQPMAFLGVPRKLDRASEAEHQECVDARGEPIIYVLDDGVLDGLVVLLDESHIGDPTERASAPCRGS